MRTKYQFFISSTFRDLHEEREAVTWTVLKTRNMPAGMEAFPAGDDRGWRIIEKTIDESDFYILILGHTYGSIDPETGMSWTEKEYRHAVEQGLPVLAFIREASATPLDRADTDPTKRAKLDAFRGLVQSQRHVRVWTTTEDLVGKVSQAIPLAIQDAEDEGKPRPGWVRGDRDNAAALKELAALSEENRRLRDENEKLQASTGDGVSRRPVLHAVPHKTTKQFKGHGFTS